MPKVFCVIFLLLWVTTSLSAQVKNKYYPFTIGNNNGINVFIEDKPMYPHYKDLFEKYGYSGNGYCWEGHILQILEKLDPTLIKHIRMDPEAGAFFASADSKDAQMKFLTLLCPIFSDDKKLTIWIKKADRSRISD